MSSIPLLSFEKVGKYRPDGRHSVAVLTNATFEVAAGSAVGIWGVRRSGKTTLLRLAAGVELADEGSVLFDGRRLSEMRAIERERLLRADIGFVSPTDWRPGHRERALDYVALPLLSTGATLHQATRAARSALRRMETIEVAEKFARTLSIGERIRVMLARSLVNRPRLLLVDEPAAVPNLGDRDDLCELLAGLARERELTLIVASEEMSSLRFADFLMSIGGGELVRSNEHKAQILPFPRLTDLRAERERR
jgi:putative ABC transport system ATP-binding protein